MIDAKPLYFILIIKGNLRKIIILTIQVVQGCDILTLSILSVELECIINKFNTHRYITTFYISQNTVETQLSS